MELNVRIKDKRGKLLNTPYAPRIMTILEDIEGVVRNRECFSIIKDGSTTTVGFVKGGMFGIPFDIALKRFNYRYRGMLHTIAKRIAGTRARRLYGINLKFFKKGLCVPQPLGFLEAADAKNSFYISRYEEVIDNLASLYVCKKGLFNRIDRLASRLAQTIAKWHLSGAVHGDLKWTNILVAKDAFFFVDTDQANLFRRPNIKGMNKDIARFSRYGVRLGAQTWLKREFLPAYASFLPDDIRGKIEGLAL